MPPRARPCKPYGQGKKDRGTPETGSSPSHVEQGAEDLAVWALSAVWLPPDAGALSELQKEDGGKILVAALIGKLSGR